MIMGEFAVQGLIRSFSSLSGWRRSHGKMHICLATASVVGKRLQCWLLDCSYSFSCRRAAEECIVRGASVYESLGGYSIARTPALLSFLDAAPKNLFVCCQAKASWQVFAMKISGGPFYEAHMVI